MAELIDIMRESLIASVKECFSTTLNIETTDSDQVSLTNMDHCLVCSIGFAGKVEGSVTVVILESCACKVVGLMLGMEFSQLDADVKDGFGEIGNMVAGGLKNRLSQAGHPFEITVPTTIVGQKIELSFPKSTIQVAKHFEGGQINFDVYVDYKIHEEQAKSDVDAKAKMKEAFLNRIKEKMTKSPTT